MNLAHQLEHYQPKGKSTTPSKKRRATPLQHALSPRPMSRTKASGEVYKKMSQLVCKNCQISNRKTTSRCPRCMVAIHRDGALRKDHGRANCMSEHAEMCEKSLSRCMVSPSRREASAPASPWQASAVPPAPQEPAVPLAEPDQPASTRRSRPARKRTRHATPRGRRSLRRNLS